MRVLGIPVVIRTQIGVSTDEFSASAAALPVFSKATGFDQLSEAWEGLLHVGGHGHGMV